MHAKTPSTTPETSVKKSYLFATDVSPENWSERWDSEDSYGEIIRCTESDLPDRLKSFIETHDLADRIDYISVFELGPEGSVEFGLPVVKFE